MYLGQIPILWMKTQRMRGQSGFIYYFRPLLDMSFVQKAVAEQAFYGRT